MNFARGIQEALELQKLRDLMKYAIAPVEFVASNFSYRAEVKQ